MSATAYQSTQEVNRTVQVPHTENTPQDVYGREMAQNFEYVAPATGSTPNPAGPDTIDLCILRNGSKVLGGIIAFDDLGANTFIEVGYRPLDPTNLAAALPTRYLGSGNTGHSVAAGSYALANSTALNINEILTYDVIVYATISGSGSAIPASTKIYGHMSVCELNG